VRPDTPQRAVSKIGQVTLVTQMGSKPIHPYGALAAASKRGAYSTPNRRLVEPPPRGVANQMAGSRQEGLSLGCP
jgi:hypothetical protein